MCEMQKIEHGIKDVLSLQLEVHSDERGDLTEIHRRSWYEPAEFIQWNMASSKANVLRGVHVHFRHYDYLLVNSGEMRLGLKDFRKDSETQGKHDVLTLKGSEPTIWIIPPGVAHGFYFPVETNLLYGVSHYWDTEDEIACRWDDPGLGFYLTEQQPTLSARDAAAGTLDEAVEAYYAALHRHE